MNFLTLKKRLARRRNQESSTLIPATDTRYGDALNECHRHVLRLPGLAALRYATLTFASVASQKLYALPSDGIARINRITEQTNDRKLEYRTGSWLDEVDPDPQTGTPYIWVPRGYSEVHKQPSNASEIFVDSTSASDTNTAYLEGIRSNGHYVSLSQTMTGTTAVSMSTTYTDIAQISKFYLSAVAVGTVTLHEDANGGTELSRLVPGDARAQFYTFELYPTPSAVVTYTCDVLRNIPEMTRDTDEPLLPEDFHDLLIDMAELRETKKSDDANRYAMLAGQIRKGTADLISFVVSHPDYTPVGPESDPPSRLGAWYPGGS